MSRQIDTSKPLSDEDREYLENFQGSALREDVSAVTGEEVILRGTSTMADQLSQIPNTGTVNPLPASVSIETPPGVPSPDEDVQGDASEEEVDPTAYYSKYKVAQLTTEINARNESREEDDKIVPASARKDDLVAAIVADDEAHPDEDEGMDDDGGDDTGE